MSGFSDDHELAVEAGRLGGTSLKKKVEGSDYYATIGKKGGETVRDRYGNDFYAQIGAKGGVMRGIRAAEKRALEPPKEPKAPGKRGRPRKEKPDGEG